MILAVMTAPIAGLRSRAVESRLDDDEAVWLRPERQGERVDGQSWTGALRTWWTLWHGPSSLEAHRACRSVWSTRSGRMRWTRPRSKYEVICLESRVRGRVGRLR